MRFTRFLIPVLAWTALCRAQAGDLRAPALGSLFDAGQRRLIPIQGIPGAAIFGDSTDLGVPIASAAIAADGSIVLALCGDERKLCLIRPKRGEIQPVSNAMDSPDWILFSPAGRAALLYRGDSNQLQVLTGLQEQPIARNIQLPVAPRSKQALAVSDDGALVLLAGGDQSWLLAQDQPDINLPIPISIRSVTFRANTHAGAVVGALGEIYAASDVASTDFRQLSSSSGDLSDPVAIRFAASNQRLLVVTGKGIVALIDTAGGSLQTTSCQCAPIAMDPISSGTLFLLTSDSSRTTYLAGESDGVPRVWFVPAAVPVADGSVQ